MSKFKTEKLLDDLGNGEHTSSQINYINWDESKHQKQVKHQGPNKLIFLKSETGSDLISHGVLAGLKMYCVQAHNKGIKKVCKGMPSHYVK